MNILKTKGSKAFGLFLETLNGEKEHLGHTDLCEILSQADKRLRQQQPQTRSRSRSGSSVFESAGGEKRVDYSQQISFPSDFLSRYASQSSESSAGYHSSPHSSLSTSTDTQREYHDIKQHLIQIERAIGAINAELAKRNVVHKELKVSSHNNVARQIVDRPSSGSGDDSSAGTPGGKVPSSQRHLLLRQKLARREPFPAIQSDVSIPSTEEEQETKSEVTGTSDKILLSNTQQLPPINTSPQQNILVSMSLLVVLSQLKF